jgi:hypothetical protein
MREVASSGATRPTCDDGQPDHSLRHSGDAGQRDGTINQQTATGNERSDAQDQHSEGNHEPPSGALPVGIDVARFYMLGQLS